MTTLERLQNWYLRQCDGEWERTYGILIGTIDNPGWMVGVSLKDTTLEKKPFDRIEKEHSEHNWVHAWIADDDVFECACGPENLDEALSIFCDWANSHLGGHVGQDPFLISESRRDTITTLERLQKWYLRHCDGEWPGHGNGIFIRTLDNPGWLVGIDLIRPLDNPGWVVRVSLKDTPLEKKPFDRIERERSEHNWVQAWIAGDGFSCACGPENLDEALSIFCDWVSSHE
jgi:hypothetical protein